MKYLRHLATLLALCLPLTATAQGATDFPSKPIRIVVPFPAGGATDAAARLVATQMSEKWGQPVVVDNRAGAGGNVGSDLVAKSAPDGYTLVMGVTGSHAINTSLYSRMPYDPVADFVAISQVAVVPNVLVVHPSVSAKNLDELVALARREPGRLNYASLGNGTAAHLGMEMLKSAAGIDVTHVPYKGSAPALTDVVAGHVPLFFSTVAAAMPAIKAGRVKALAVTSASRVAMLPDVPTVDEAAGVKGYEMTVMYGVWAPAKTPSDVVDRLNGDIVKVVKSPAFSTWLQEQGVDPRTSTPSQMNAYIQAEMPKLERLVKVSGAKMN